MKIFNKLKRFLKKYLIKNLTFDNYVLIDMEKNLVKSMINPVEVNNLWEN